MARTKKDQTVETPTDELLAGQPAAGADLPRLRWNRAEHPGTRRCPIWNWPPPHRWIPTVPRLTWKLMKVESPTRMTSLKAPRPI